MRLIVFRRHRTTKTRLVCPRHPGDVLGVTEGGGGVVVADGRSRGEMSGQRRGVVSLPITTSHLHLVAVSPLPAPSSHRVTTLSGLRAADGHLHYLARARG